MKQYILAILLLLSTLIAQAQIDTLRPDNRKLNRAAWRNSKSSYAVYFEDSTGKRLSSAAIWDRTIRRTTKDGQTQYEFIWDWYQKDSLIAHVTTVGQWPSLAPLSHTAIYPGRGNRSYLFQNNVVTIPDSARRTAKDSSFRVTMQPAAFAFPMDLEVFPLLPFKGVGQRFAIAFYEPGRPSSAYYSLRVTGREKVPVVGQATVDCWVLQIEYAPNAYATFWISDQPREVIKVREYFQGRYRYKVKLY